MKKQAVIQLIIAFLFTFCGGFCDAYTLINRGGLYSNMQTGNLVKFSIALGNGTFEPMFFLPIVFFCLGILSAVIINKKKKHNTLILCFLFAISLAAGFLPNDEVWNIVCVCALSITGAMQFEAFNVCLTTNYTSTMCTNNMRLLMENAVNFFDDNKNKKVFFFLTIILCFALGAVVSALISKTINTYTISILAAIYLIIFILRFISEKEKENVESSL